MKRIEAEWRVEASMPMGRKADVIRTFTGLTLRETLLKLAAHAKATGFAIQLREGRGRLDVVITEKDLADEYEAAQKEEAK